MHAQSLSILNIIRTIMVIAFVVSLFKLISLDYTADNNYKEYVASRLELLNKPTNTLDRALFKELSSCIKNNNISLWTDVFENQNFYRIFEKSKADISFDKQVDTCLNGMIQESAFQNSSLTNIESVQSSLNSFDAFKFKVK